MFGYVRPCRPEMKCRDFDLYRATYCGLCRCLRENYGMIAPMLLNFDFTFLALLLWEPEEEFHPCKGRCHANLLIKKEMCPDSPALKQAAAESMILAYWKLRDSVEDDGFWGGMPARALSVLLRRAYKKAARDCPAFDEKVRTSLKELSKLEKSGCTSLDRTADSFATLLQAAAPGSGTNSRVLTQLFYHLGRWIYLVDARDDLAEDREKGEYNPVAARFGPEGNDEQLKLTMNHSLELAAAAFQLGDFGVRTPVIENILYLGLPLVQRAVFEGSWAQIKKQKIWRNNT